jgi:hypothetical protein
VIATNSYLIEVKELEPRVEVAGRFPGNKCENGYE